MLEITPSSKWRYLTYDDGWLYCACLYHCGYSDWRVQDSIVPIHERFSERKYNIVPTRGKIDEKRYTIL